MVVGEGWWLSGLALRSLGHMERKLMLQKPEITGLIPTPDQFDLDVYRHCVMHVKDPASSHTAG